MSIENPEGIGVPLTTGQAKFLSLLVQNNAISGKGRPATLKGIYSAGRIGLTDSELKRLDEHREGGDRLPPELEARNCVTPQMIKEYSKILKIKKWSKIESPYLLRKRGYQLNGATYIHTHLQAAIALVLYERAKGTSELFVVRDELTAELKTHAPEEVERELDWLTEQEYIERSSERIRISDKLRGHIEYIRRIVEYVNQRNEFEVVKQQVEHPFNGSPLTLRTWDDGKWFSEIVAQTIALEKTRSESKEKRPREHIRIWMTAFSRRNEDHEDKMADLTRLLEGGVQVSVLMLNPETRVLLNARHGLRTDYPKRRFKSAVAWAKWEAKDQINRMNDHPFKLRKLLRLKVSDQMPIGFIVRNSQRALWGFLVASGSFTEAPLLDISNDSPFWRTLSMDWDTRWRKAKDPEPQRTRR